MALVLKMWWFPITLSLQMRCHSSFQVLCVMRLFGQTLEQLRVLGLIIGFLFYHLGSAFHLGAGSNHCRCLECPNCWQLTTSVPSIGLIGPVTQYLGPRPLAMELHRFPCSECKEHWHKEFLQLLACSICLLWYRFLHLLLSNESCMMERRK